MSDDSATREDRIRRALERSRSRIEPVRRRPNPGDPAPQTRFQEGLWYNAMLAGESGLPSEPRPAAFRLLGSLDLDAITAVIGRVQERHAVLRTVFPARDDVPVQVVTKDRAEIEFHDLTSVPMEERVDQARRFARSLALTPFDLEHEPPFRPHIIRLDDEDHLLLLAMHHLVFDGWSAEILRWELEYAYAASVGIPCEQVPPLEFDVADYATWERSREERDTIEDQLQYWRGRLEGIEGELELPRESPAPTGDAPVPVVFDLEPGLMGRFMDVSRSLDATPFMMLLATSQILAARLSRQHDFVVGVATAGRTNSAFDRHIGCFINMMLVRAQLSDDMTFAEAVTAARREVVGGLANQQAPFSRVVSEHGRSYNQAPFNLLVQMRSFPSLPSVPSAEVSWAPFNLEMPTGVALTIEGHDLESGLRVFMSYNPKVFSPDTIVRWSGHLRALIASAIEAPDTSVWDLELLTEDERRQVIRKFNEPTHLSSPVLVSDQFAAQATATPDLVAFEEGERAVTYRELLRDVNGFTRRVRDFGAGPGSRVVLFMENSLDAAVAVLAVLGLGAAYVPVDPAVSASWLAGIVRDTEPVAVITHRRLLSEVPDSGVLTVAFEDLAGPATEGATISIQPNDLAYVCYTSGSTGAPKGVMITQANVASVLENQGLFHFGPGSRVLQIHSIAFDLYVTSLLAPLVSGATAVLYEREAFGTAERFIAWCDAAEISHLDIPTSVFHTVVDEMARAGLTFPSTLRHIAIAGEQVRADAVEAFYSVRHPDLSLHNDYGPTETTVWVLTKDLSVQSEVALEHVPIGSPPPNVWAYVLDNRGQPAPIGVAGELVIGGPQVGAGYFGDPDLTAERFVADPFSEVAHARVYRTGDLARWLPNGDVEFLGRMDRQVSIRGFRVEPEAIEMTLREHPRIADAVVVDAPIPDGSTTLRAYVVPSGPEPAEADLRSWCRASLPEFMVPSSYTVLDAIPLTISRKIDRSRLPEPTSTDAPSTQWDPVTEAVAGIWSESLGLQDVPAGGDFFDLGGHSLVAMRVIGRVRRIFEVEVPLSTLFDYPTIEAFSAVIARDASPNWQQNEVDALLAGLADLNPEEAAALLVVIDPDGDS